MDRRPPPSADPVAEPRSAADAAVAERMLELLRAGADVRPTKVNRVRSSVRSDTYENDLKLSIAVDRLAREMPTNESPNGLRVADG